jgi:hypothetical protein
MPTDPVEPIDEDEEFAALAGTDVRKKKSLMERIREACQALSEDDYNGVVDRDRIQIMRIDLDDDNLDSYD